MQSLLQRIWDESTGDIGDIARRMIDALCDEYGVSERTADKIVERFISDL